jgi:putative transposase
VAQKKISVLPRIKRLAFVEQADISLSRQGELVSLHKSAFYYQAKGESKENLALMLKIDQLYLKMPFLGYRKMCQMLHPTGEVVNQKRVRRLMRVMGLEAIYSKPNLSKANKEHEKYPYLLTNLCISRNNQVWSTDITYIPMANGFMYLVALMDWY